MLPLLPPVDRVISNDTVSWFQEVRVSFAGRSLMRIVLSGWASLDARQTSGGKRRQWSHPRTRRDRGVLGLVQGHLWALLLLVASPVIAREALLKYRAGNWPW